MKFLTSIVVCLAGLVICGCTSHSQPKQTPQALAKTSNSEEVVAEIWVEGKMIDVRQQINIPGVIILHSETVQKYDMLPATKPTTHKSKEKLLPHREPVLTKENAQLLAEISIAGTSSDNVSASCAKPGHIILRFPYEKGGEKQVIIQYSASLYTPLDW